MKILLAHNFYQYTGGEDISFASEKSMLQKNGVEVSSYTRNNHEILQYNLRQKFSLMTNPIWSSRTYHEIRQIIRQEKFDLVHVQNFFPLISPSVFDACYDSGVPVIFSVRNYRLFCLNGLFFRNNHICESCLQIPISLPGIFHHCYRNSVLQSAVVASMQSYHRWKRTWFSKVDRFLAISEFSRQKLIESGIPPLKIKVKPNFIEDPGLCKNEGKYAIYAGRIVDEKGIRTLLDAWKDLHHIPLLVVGDGPVLSDLRYEFESATHIQFMGPKSHQETLDLIKSSKFLVFPTEWYETFGRVVIEAYACGKPVLCSEIGAVQELVQHGVTGLLFKPGNSDQLRDKAIWLWEHSEECQSMGINARREYEEKYTPQVNYLQLLSIYQTVISNNPHSLHSQSLKQE